MNSGSCLCGGVRFEIQGPVREIALCHCSQCRKASGSAFSAVAVVAKDDFRYTAGLALVRAYKATERLTRFHCVRCGSPLPILADWDNFVGIPAGLLDEDPGCRPSFHLFVASKAPWWEITDDQPQFAEWPPEQDMNERAKRLRTGGVNV